MGYKNYNRNHRQSGKRIGRGSRRGKRNLVIGLIVMAILVIVLTGVMIFKRDLFGGGEYRERTGNLIEDTKPDIDVQLLTVNPNSRPGTETQRIKGVVIHYTANPGSSAMANRSYFESLKNNRITQASSHFIVGLQGEIVQCIPTWEVAYASNSRNNDTVSIESCHPDASGKFNQSTYDSVVELTAWLCLKFDLNEKDVIRHYDITGKACPKYYVDHPKKWKQFQEDVKKTLEKMKK